MSDKPGYVNKRRTGPLAHPRRAARPCPDGTYPGTPADEAGTGDLRRWTWAEPPAAVPRRRRRRHGRLRVVIAHRLSSIRDVDRIYVMDRGRIVESGRYDDLMRRAGVFAALSRRQIIQG